MQFTKTNNNQEQFQAIEWEGELTEDTLQAVSGGILGDAVNTVTATNSAIGNGGRPTSGAAILAGTTAVNAGNYLIGVGSGAESGLQALNGGLANTAGNV